MEGFNYDTVLYINIGFHTLRLDGDAQKICTFILSWGGVLHETCNGHCGLTKFLPRENVWSNGGHGILKNIPR